MPPAAVPQAHTSKEARYGNPRPLRSRCPPPRRTTAPAELASTVPLDQLWSRIPPIRRQELLGQLTRILAQRLAPPGREEADE
jgi:hypothetical protein